MCLHLDPATHCSVRAPRPRSLTQAAEDQSLACAYASLILHDGGKPISAVSYMCVGVLFWCFACCVYFSAGVCWRSVFFLWWCLCWCVCVGVCVGVGVGVCVGVAVFVASVCLSICLCPCLRLCPCVGIRFRASVSAPGLCLCVSGVWCRCACVCVSLRPVSRLFLCLYVCMCHHEHACEARRESVNSAHTPALVHRPSTPPALHRRNRRDCQVPSA